MFDVMSVWRLKRAPFRDRRKARLLLWLASWFRNPVYESMTRVAIDGYTVRVWREEKSWRYGPDLEVVNAINAGYISMDEMIHQIGSLPRVAAVEILDKAGNGSLFYPDWK